MEDTLCVYNLFPSKEITFRTLKQALDLSHPHYKYKPPWLHQAIKLLISSGFSLFHWVFIGRARSINQFGDLRWGINKFSSSISMHCAPKTEHILTTLFSIFPISGFRSINSEDFERGLRSLCYSLEIWLVGFHE